MKVKVFDDSVADVEHVIEEWLRANPAIEIDHVVQSVYWSEPRMGRGAARALTTLFYTEPGPAEDGEIAHGSLPSRRRR